MADKRQPWYKVFEEESNTIFNELRDLQPKEKAEYALRIETKV